MMWRSTIVVVACVAGMSILEARKVYALGGNLKTPNIAIPKNESNGEPDPIVTAIQRVLTNHQKRFVSGSFINAHSVLHFNGDTHKLNSLLKDLSETDGAVISIVFSTDAGIARVAFPDRDAADNPCGWSIDHNGWADAKRLTITIFPGDGGIRLEELVLPDLRGAKPNPQTVKLPTAP